MSDTTAPRRPFWTRKEGKERSYRIDVNEWERATAAARFYGEFCTFESPLLHIAAKFNVSSGRVFTTVWFLGL